MYSQVLNSWKKFSERPLPSEQSFLSELNNVGTTDKTIEMPKKYGINRINNLGEYQDLYNITDVLLLYFSSNYLNKTNVGPELLTDTEMLHVYDRSIRARITTVIKNYVKTNNKYIDDFNSSTSCSSHFSLPLAINMDMLYWNPYLTEEINGLKISP